MKNYSTTHYIGDKETRYLLGALGKRNILFIGVNPSKADNFKPDPTIRKIIGFAKHNGYDGWFIINIYPQRSTDPKNLHEFIKQTIIDKNRGVIKDLVERVKIDLIVGAWGNLINSRKYLRIELSEIIKYAKLEKYPWLCIDRTIDGTPKHPSRTAYKTFENFDIKNYCEI